MKPIKEHNMHIDEVENLGHVKSVYLAEPIKKPVNEEDEK